MIVVAVLLAIAVVWFAFEMWNAPEGFEDRAGFHQTGPTRLHQLTEEWGMTDTPEIARAKSILRDHVEGLHADFDDPTVGCLYRGCDDAFWAISFSLGHVAPIEEMLE